MAVDCKINGGELGDLKSILSGNERDFLVRSNGDQVKITDISNKVMGLYFATSSSKPCQMFTPMLVETYKELASNGSDFEVVFVSGDSDEDSFRKFFSGLPWLAIPFSDSGSRNRLKELFSVTKIIQLLILDGNGKVITDKGFHFVTEYGPEGYPFTPEKIKNLNEDEEASKKEQTLQSILVRPSRDFLISNAGGKVPVSDLEGKIVGLYFTMSPFDACQEFNPILVEMYKKLKEKGENFEIVMIYMSEDKSSFEQDFAGMPWLAIPYNDRSCMKLLRYFELGGIPSLIIIGPDGKTMQNNVAHMVEEMGVEAYPFTTEKMEEFAKREKAKAEARTVESLLVSGEQNYFIGKSNVKIPFSDLVGKNILLYFSAHWCPPCRAFTPKLAEVYHKIKERDSALEIIFVSWDHDQESYDEYFTTMPWLALPFKDSRCNSLNRTFKIGGIPSLVCIGPTGKSSKQVRDLVLLHGADAYPFTEERLRELKAQSEEMAKEWPKTVRHDFHKEHELVLNKQERYACDLCKEGAEGFAYVCRECGIDLHPKCALAGDEKKKAAGDEPGVQETKGKEGYVCDGDVCRKV